jgi:hypothetical protein
MGARQNSTAATKDPDGSKEPGRWQPLRFGDVDPDEALLVWNDHNNDIDDYCGNSDQVAEIDDDEDPSDARCPGGCRASRAIRPGDAH